MGALAKLGVILTKNEVRLKNVLFIPSLRSKLMLIISLLVVYLVISQPLFVNSCVFKLTAACIDGSSGDIILLINIILIIYYVYLYNNIKY